MNWDPVAYCREGDAGFCGKSEGDTGCWGEVLREIGAASGDLVDVEELGRPSSEEMGSCCGRGAVRMGPFDGVRAFACAPGQVTCCLLTLSS
jgi:hypothetical protein